MSALSGVVEIKEGIMGRKKVRNYPPKGFYEEKLDGYFREHRHEVIGNLLDTLGYESVERLQEDECHMKFGLDCGWIHLHPRNKEMSREWGLDNGIYGAYVCARPSLNCQSTTIKRVQVEKAVKDLGLEDVFYISERLD